MKLTDLRALCTALGFTVVVIKDGEVPKAEGARRALEVAGLIEEFCRISVPDAFERGRAKKLRVVDFVSRRGAGRFERAGQLAAVMVEIMREQGGYMPQDLAAKGFT